MSIQDSPVQSFSIDGNEPILASEWYNSNSAIMVASHSLGFNLDDTGYAEVTITYYDDSGQYSESKIGKYDNGSASQFYGANEYVIDVENKKVYENDIDITDQIFVQSPAQYISEYFDKISGICLTT